MKKLWLLTLLLITSCSKISTSGYKVFTNVSYYYDDNLHYVVRLDEKDYILDIDYVYFVKRGDVRIDNKFYQGNPNRLVIYRDNH